MEPSLNDLQARLGYRFQTVAYLRQAVTHSSYANETGEPNHHLLCNERLEFLGDAVLSIITSDFLYGKYPKLPEGLLSRLRSALVREEALASYSHVLGLGEFLLLGKGERNSGGAEKPAIVADAFEAVLAAIYLDAGGMNAGIDAVSRVLLPFLEDAVNRLPDVNGMGTVDCKSRLQEFVQKDGGGCCLDYKLVGESGPDHNKSFQVQVYLDSNLIGEGVGHSKKAAEQAAAKAALALFGIDC